jgi:hypothetical protein
VTEAKEHAVLACGNKVAGGMQNGIAVQPCGHQLVPRFHTAPEESQQNAGPVLGKEVSTVWLVESLGVVYDHVADLEFAARLVGTGSRGFFP